MDIIRDTDSDGNKHKNPQLVNVQKETWEYSAINVISSSNLSTQSSASYAEQESERQEELMQIENAKQTLAFKKERTEMTH